MTDFTITRRGVLAGAAASGTLGPAAASAAMTPGLLTGTREQLAARVGERFGVGLSTVELAEIVPLTPRVRPPMALAHREPFALVFRHVAGPRPGEGTHLFLGADGATPLMVSDMTGPDGAGRLEAVLN